MQPGKIIVILFGVWIACQGLAWVHPYFTAPTGDGFVRGMNLIGLFMTWQSLAVLVSVGLLAVRLMRADAISPAQKWLGQGPIILQALAITGLVLFFSFAT
ncbi:MAG: hypothetical protein AAGH68_05255 [Pseudomonadota bacterium]